MSDSYATEADETTRPSQPKDIDPKTGKPYEPVEIPAPKRSTWDHLLQRTENTPPPRDDA